jgi:hypothetical protein
LFIFVSLATDTYLQSDEDEGLPEWTEIPSAWSIHSCPTVRHSNPGPKLGFLSTASLPINTVDPGGIL